MIGVPVPGISTIGLGRSSVYGRSREPWPPARTTACVGRVAARGSVMGRTLRGAGVAGDGGRPGLWGPRCWCGPGGERAQPGARGTTARGGVGLPGGRYHAGCEGGVADGAGVGLGLGGAVDADRGPAQGAGDGGAVLRQGRAVVHGLLELGERHARVLLVELDEQLL